MHWIVMWSLMGQPFRRRSLPVTIRNNAMRQLRRATRPREIPLAPHERRVCTKWGITIVPFGLVHQFGISDRLRPISTSGAVDMVDPAGEEVLDFRTPRLQPVV